MPLEAFRHWTDGVIVATKAIGVRWVSSTATIARKSQLGVDSSGIADMVSGQCYKTHVDDFDDRVLPMREKSQWPFVVQDRNHQRVCGTISKNTGGRL